MATWQNVCEREQKEIMMHPSPVSPRIPPLQPPYEPEVAAALSKWMPPDGRWEPLKLFRTLVRNKELSDRMRPLGAGLLGPHSSLDAREREIVIDRVCARCGCAYEWGVHVVAYGTAVGLSPEQLHATVSGSPQDPAWSEREQLLCRLVDELHETSTVCDSLWELLASNWTAVQLLELIILVGWYHLISFVVNGIQVEHEPWAAPFPSADE
jgi:alkylhydroperoxidase family enzyme